MVEGTRSFLERLMINSLSVCLSRNNLELIPETMNRTGMNQGYTKYMSIS